MAFDKKDYPALGFNFKVTSTHSLSGSPATIAANLAKNLLFGPDESFFQSVSGITATIGDGSTLVDGGINNRQYKLPGSTTYSDLKLSRGIIKGSSPLGKWCRTFLIRDVFWYGVERRTLNVMLLDRSGDNILMTWSFYNCYPKEIEIGTFSADKSEIAVETLTIAYTHFNQVFNDSWMSLIGRE